MLGHSPEKRSLYIPIDKRNLLTWKREEKRPFESGNGKEEKLNQYHLPPGVKKSQSDRTGWVRFLISCWETDPPSFSLTMSTVKLWHALKIQDTSQVRNPTHRDNLDTNDLLCFFHLRTSPFYRKVDQCQSWSMQKPQTFALREVEKCLYINTYVFFFFFF